MKGVAAIVTAATLAGCASETQYGAVILQAAIRSPAGGEADGATLLVANGDSAVVALGSDTIAVRRVSIVAHQVALQPAETWECDPDEQPCAELEVGPMRLDLPLVDGAQLVLETPVIATSYAVFQVQLHTADESAHADFLASHPDLADVSVRIEGAYSRSGVRRDFLISSRFNEIEELALVPTLHVEPRDTIRLTLRLDLARVFSSENGTLLDPATANPGGPAEDRLRDNIRLALAAFRDENHDGLDDRPGGHAPHTVGDSRDSS